MVKNSGLINLGYDPGRHFVKIYMDGGKKYMNMNVVSAGFERRLLTEEEGDAQNYLDVEVYRAGDLLGRFFVGGMALSNNSGDLRWSTRATPKFSDVDVVPDDIIKMATNIAYTQYKRGQKNTIRIRLCTGSATEDYFENPKVLETFKTTLGVPYTVKFLHPMFDGAEVEIHFEEISFRPEGTSTVISSCYDDNLKIREYVQKVITDGMNIIGFNIGSTTSDAAIMKPDMTFESKGFFGVEVGTNDALNKIRRILKSEYQYDVNSFKLAYMIQNYSEINYRGKKINLENIKKAPFDSLFASLKTQFFDQCDLRGLDVGEAGAFVVAGGGVLELGTKLDKFITGVPTIIDPDPLFQDARGYWLETKFAEVKAKMKDADIFEKEDEG